MCVGHDRRWRRGLRGPALEAPFRGEHDGQCKVPGCGRAIEGSGCLVGDYGIMCRTHSRRWERGTRGEELLSPIRLHVHKGQSVAWKRIEAKVRDFATLEDECDMAIWRYDFRLAIRAWVRAGMLTGSIEFKP